MLDKPIKAVEFSMEFAQMKNYKAPGLDGYLVFYKSFVMTLSSVMIMTFNSIMGNIIYPPSWNESLLIPILK